MNRLIRKGLPVLALAFALSLGACALGRDPTPEARAEAQAAAAARAEARQISRGRDIATRSCVSCHAAGADDVSRNQFAPPLRDLSERYQSTLLADAFPERMKNGHPLMPSFGFSDSQVDALLAYILSIQERKGA